MKKLKLFALATLALVGFAGTANAQTVLLASDDFVGISFWIISNIIFAGRNDEFNAVELSISGTNSTIIPACSINSDGCL